MNGKDAAGRAERSRRGLARQQRRAFVQQAFRLAILRALEVCVNHEVHGVNVRPGGSDGGLIRPDRLLPHSQHRKDMRRHVKSMRGRRGDLPVAFRRAQRA